MSTYLELINFEKVFSLLKEPPVIINDVMDTSEEEREKLKNSIYTRYNTDLLSNLSSCECGETKGEYNVGVECPVCHTKVVSAMDTDIEPILWMRSPKGVRKLINPIVWTMLNDFFTSSNFELLMWICDTSYRPQIKIPKVLDDVQNAGITRGYNYFIDNFDDILDVLFSLKAFKAKRQKAVYLKELLRRSRDCVFTDYIPLPNKTLLVIEDTNHGIFVDPIIVGAIDAIQTIACIDSSLSEHSITVKENRTIKALSKLAEFNDNYYKLSFSKKGGIFRKNTFGCRSHFSFRAVISSITDKHNYDDIYIPWGVGTSVFRIHLLNKLMRRNMTLNNAVGFLNEHAQKYHPLLDELFKEIISESKDGRVSVITQRNPSLKRGSAQLTGIAKVKTNPEDPTVSISILIVNDLGADFDGDALNFSLAVDNFMAEQYADLAPHKNVFDLNEPFKVSSTLSMPKPVIATISSWFHANEDLVDPRKLAAMAMLEDA